MCKEEVAHAAANSKRLIPIVLRPVDPGQLPPPLADFQWISFAADAFERAFGTLIEALDTDLEWKRTHTRLLVRAKEWENREHNDSFLLRGMDLQDAVQWLVQAPTVKKQKPS